MKEGGNEKKNASEKGMKWKMKGKGRRETEVVEAEGDWNI